MSFRIIVRTMSQERRKPHLNNGAVRINTIITGELARWLLDWKRRGLVKSNPDAVRQALRSLHEQLLESDEKFLAIQREKARGDSKREN